MPDVVRHGKPSNAYLATLRYPTRKDFDKLVKACLEALICDEIDVIISFTYTMKLPDTFPRGVFEAREGANNLRRIKAQKLLTWLNENGHTEFTVDKLHRQRTEFTKAEKEITNLFSSSSH